MDGMNDNLIVGPSVSTSEGPSEFEASNYIITSEFYNSYASSTPHGSLFWVPNGPEENRLSIGQKFKTLESAIQAYTEYAEKYGFDTRLSTQKQDKDGNIKIKYILCNKAFAPENVSVDTLDEKDSGKQKRNSNVQKTDCKARVRFRLSDEKDCYILYNFEDRHNHELVSSEYKHLLRKRRKLDDMEEKFIHRVASNNIGATRGHNVLSSIRGSRYLVHGTITDFKNCRRNLNVFIENNELSAFFWADETAKCNYEAFGDIISFDATYRTNKYCMVFVLFTGMDNHRKCVTIGAGMIAKENIESFTFLLEIFLKAFKKQPNIIVTDQDPAMKVAVSKVFTESKHRLCTWFVEM
ncbi:protein FAR1-RELATED SEQUENCE 5-like [Helianthus annuus]|uniref:protein FAR1-RELATED SEQUENCE 5-like n=1 Tax=Helianthus annuus TaxID=4232 RepID=UPI0016531F7A|nr:protein FAR1-RELATED SEQUENCE 5-like [Helianthus annuus]